jgi:hypothetical protein
MPSGQAWLGAERGLVLVGPVPVVRVVTPDRGALRHRELERGGDLYAGELASSIVFSMPALVNAGVPSGVRIASGRTPGSGSIISLIGSLTAAAAAS